MTLITLILFATKNKYSKLAIKIWSGIFFILAGTFLIIGPLLQILGNWMSGEEIPDKLNVIFRGGANVCVGLIVFIGASKYIHLKGDEVRMNEKYMKEVDGNN